MGPAARRPSLVFVVALAATAVAAILVLGSAPAAEAQSGTIPPDTGTCEEHQPIEITENVGEHGFVLGPRLANFVAPTYRPGSGVVGGLGTEAHPYVIDGWCITPDPDLLPSFEDTSGYDAAIRIANANAHVIVRDNVLPAEGDFTTGIRIENADNVRIESNTIADNPGHGVHVSASKNVDVRGNTIEANGADAVRVDDGRRLTIEENAIANNADAAVRLTDTQRSTVEANEIEANGQGLVLDDSDRNELVDNEIDRSAILDGIQLYQSDDNSIRDNLVEGTGHGIGLFVASDGNTIESNTIQQTNGRGIDVSFSAGNELRSNTVEANTDTGIRVAGPDNLVDGNAIRDNGVGIRVASTGDGSTLQRNDIEANRNAGLEVGDLDQPLDATGNWWGASDGPSGGVQDACTGTVADGGGQAIVVKNGGQVCFEPWATGTVAG